MPLLWLSLAFLTGIALSEYLGLPAVTWLGLAGLALAAPLLRRFWRRLFTGSSGWSRLVAGLVGAPLSKLQPPPLWWARLSAAVDWRYGDRLLLEGWLETPPEFESFSYRDYLARQGIYAYMPSAAAERLG